MVQEIKIGMLKFPNISLKYSELHKVRGYFGNQYSQFDLLHNHDSKTGKNIYRYPGIQYKIIDKEFAMLSVGEQGLEEFKTIFLNNEKIVLEGNMIPVNEKGLDIKYVTFGDTDEYFLYEFITPWIALNSKNKENYLNLENQSDRNIKLNSILIQNIISLCKYVKYDVKNRLKPKVDVSQIPVNLKGYTFMGFKGKFLLNFILPDYIGLGKSSSRGYGMIKKVM